MPVHTIILRRVNAMYGLHEALLMVHEEGIENAWGRHRDMHQRLLAGLDEIGLTMVVDEKYRLPQLNGGFGT